MGDNQPCFLVMAFVDLLGGGCKIAFDAIEASSSHEAKSVALNSFILAGDSQAISFGEQTFLPGVIASISIEVVAAIDLSHEFNEKWVYSIESWKEFERALTQGKKSKTAESVDLFTGDPPG